jgi:hypothetical protein
MCTVADRCGSGVAAAAGERSASGVRNRGRVKSACIADTGLARAQGGALIARRGPEDRAGTRAGVRRSARRPRAWRSCTRAITASATGSARRSRGASPRRASRPTWWTCSPPTRRSARGARARRGWRQVALLLKLPLGQTCALGVCLSGAAYVSLVQLVVSGKGREYLLTPFLTCIRAGQAVAVPWQLARARLVLRRVKCRL